MRSGPAMNPRFPATILLLCALAAGARAGDVENVRVWAGPDKTRVVLDLDRAVDYSVFSLDGPDRLVVDLERSAMEHRPSLNPEHSGVVRGIRHGIREGTDLRVVLDLSEPARAKTFLLEPVPPLGSGPGCHAAGAGSPGNGHAASDHPNQALSTQGRQSGILMQVHSSPPNKAGPW